MAFSVESFKRTFFDAEAVTGALAPEVKKALSKFGASVRTRAKSSLKYGTGTAAPGKPPVVHTTRAFTRKRTKKGVTTQQAASPLRELIFFGYDADEQSVVIGPALGGPQTGAPRALEEGGSAAGSAAGLPGAKPVRPHPYMGPAFKAELAKVGDDFRNLIR